MKHAVYAPIFNDYGDPARLVELAVAAEDAGYDGFFIWDHLAFEPAGRLDLVDAIVVLGAIAQATERIRLGAMITPLARRRPWKFAREMVTLDHLSRGRVNIGVGLGEPAEVEFAAFGEDPAARTRAARLDEGLQIADQLMRGQEVNHSGTYYQVSGAQFAPRSQQQPRIPVWVAASLPARAGLRRATQWDGVIPVQMPADFVEQPDSSIDWSQWWLDCASFTSMVAYARGRGVAADFDYVASGRLGERGGETPAEFQQCGATWWFDWAHEAPGSFAASLAAVQRGPAR
jgi:alkanesulfonate monooxygenase SsuD/methylene tetrahydromethanopterin reductase-like flavin-dependent oxidoreductase (luciferase family)